MDGGGIGERYVFSCLIDCACGTDVGWGLLGGRDGSVLCWFVIVVRCLWREADGGLLVVNGIRDTG